MFDELDAVTLVSPVALKQIWDLPKNSPLLKHNPESGLVPGDMGTIVLVQGDGEAFEVEFMEPNGYTVAIATVYPEQIRPVADGDIENYRFWKTKQS